MSSQTDKKVSLLLYFIDNSNYTFLKVRIGCSSGFWGDTVTSVPQLVYGGNIQVNIVFSSLFWYSLEFVFFYSLNVLF